MAVPRAGACYYTAKSIFFLEGFFAKLISGSAAAESNRKNWQFNWKRIGFDMGIFKLLHTIYKTLKAIVHDSWVGLYEKGNLIQIVEHTMLGNPEDLAEDFCLGKSEFNK